MTKPTVGRKAYFEPPLNGIFVVNGPEPLDATVVAVHGNGLVNLVVFDAIGNMHTPRNIPFLQDGEKITNDYSISGYAYWMPYQIKQAKKEAESQPIECVAGIVDQSKEAASILGSLSTNQLISLKTACDVHTFSGPTDLKIFPCRVTQDDVYAECVRRKFYVGELKAKSDANSNSLMKYSDDQLIKFMEDAPFNARLPHFTEIDGIAFHNDTIDAVIDRRKPK